MRVMRAFCADFTNARTQCFGGGCRQHRGIDGSPLPAPMGSDRLAPWIHRQTRHEGSPAPSGNLRSLPCARPSTATHHQCKRSCSFGRWSGDSDSASRPESSRSFTTSVLIDRACAHLKFRCWPKGTTKQWYQAQTLPSCAQPTKVQMLIRRTWKERSG